MQLRRVRSMKKSAPSPTPTKKRPSATRTHLDAARSFPIVGIGASAGGLEAVVQFLEHVPADCGMAFAVVQHLDPTQRGMLPELLQRATTMKVVQVKDRTKVKGVTDVKNNIIVK